jgi:hypothetical protein
MNDLQQIERAVEWFNGLSEKECQEIVLAAWIERGNRSAPAFSSQGEIAEMPFGPKLVVTKESAQ